MSGQQQIQTQQEMKMMTKSMTVLAMICCRRFPCVFIMLLITIIAASSMTTVSVVVDGFMIQPSLKLIPSLDLSTSLGRVAHHPSSSSSDIFLRHLYLNSKTCSSHTVSQVVHPSATMTTSLSMSLTDSKNDIGEQQPPASSLVDLHYRLATPDDIPTCCDIEISSYPSDEAATLDSLNYRQEHANDYFLLCCTHDNENDDTKQEEDNNETIMGFCCATRCNEFTEESMSTQHDPNGSLLAIHSVVIKDEYRRNGIATKLLRNYIHHIQTLNQEKTAKQLNDDNVSTTGSSYLPIDSIVLLAKSHLLGFYVQCGFQVLRPSPIIHGKDLWYELEYKLLRTLPLANDEQWFVKTEQFIKPYPQVKLYLEEHTKWIQSLRTTTTIATTSMESDADGGEDFKYCITSGYRVDSEGKPGGGGLMIFAAKNYDEALRLVLQDPLIKNDCVTWELNGWLSQVGNMQLR